MQESLVLTEKERDILLNILSNEVIKINKLNNTMKVYLEHYRQEVMDIYRKVADSMDED